MTATAPALEVRELEAGYGQRPVVRGVSLTLDAGAIVSLLGANGAGKTTTLRALSGVIPASGEILLNGSSIVGASPSAVLRAGLSHVPEGRGTFPNLTVEENLRVGATARRDRQIDQDVQRWFEVFPILGERRRQRAGSLSGGEQQMLALARAMMSRPRVLLLDEPSMGLAPTITATLMGVLQRLNAADGISILLVEQNANAALAIATSAYVLADGEIVLSGPARELRDDDRVRRAYLQV